jgi:hypothetical protein
LIGETITCPNTACGRQYAIPAAAAGPAATVVAPPPMPAHDAPTLQAPADPLSGMPGIPSSAGDDDIPGLKPTPPPPRPGPPPVPPRPGPPLSPPPPVMSNYGRGQYTPTSGPNEPLSLLSMIFGIVGLPTCICCGIGGIFGAAAIILGVLGRKKVANDPNLSGREMAVAGIVLGIIDVLLGILYWVFNIASAVANNM